MLRPLHAAALTIMPVVPDVHADEASIRPPDLWIFEPVSIRKALPVSGQRLRAGPGVGERDGELADGLGPEKRLPAGVRAKELAFPPPGSPRIVLPASTLCLRRTAADRVSWSCCVLERVITVFLWPPPHCSWVDPPSTPATLLSSLVARTGSPFFEDFLRDMRGFSFEACCATPTKSDR